MANDARHNGFASKGKVHFTKGAWSIPHQLGVHFNTVTLVSEVGPEVVLILKEGAEFVDQIRKQGPLKLMLKAGAVRTSAGPILFMVWWFPPLINKSPFAAYELLSSPESSPTGTQLLAKASKQTHLHLVILDEKEEILDVVEFENNYGLDHLVAIGAEISRNLVGYDFTRAGRAFFQEVSQDSLWGSEPNLGI
jgi:hypothetical protein